MVEGNTLYSMIGHELKFEKTSDGCLILYNEIYDGSVGSYQFVKPSSYNGWII